MIGRWLGILRDVWTGERPRWLCPACGSDFPRHYRAWHRRYHANAR